MILMLNPKVLIWTDGNFPFIHVRRGFKRLAVETKVKESVQQSDAAGVLTGISVVESDK